MCLLFLSRGLPRTMSTVQGLQIEGNSISLNFLELSVLLGVKGIHIKISKYNGYCR